MVGAKGIPLCWGAVPLGWGLRSAAGSPVWASDSVEACYKRDHPTSYGTIHPNYSWKLQVLCPSPTRRFRDGTWKRPVEDYAKGAQISSEHRASSACSEKWLWPLLRWRQSPATLRQSSTAGTAECDSSPPDTSPGGKGGLPARTNESSVPWWMVCSCA